MPAVALEVEHRVDHVLDHLRASDLAVLGDVADQQQCAAGRLGEPDEGLGGGAHLADGAGSGLQRVGPQRLNRIDDDQVGSLAFRQRCENVRQIGLRGETDGRAGQAQPLGP